jgi:hypothetical protein
MTSRRQAQWPTSAVSAIEVGADGVAEQFPVCTENLSSGVVVVKSAKDGV